MVFPRDRREFRVEIEGISGESELVETGKEENREI